MEIQITKTNALIGFVPGAKPYADEIEAIEQAETDIANGDVVDLASVSWQ